MPLLAVPHRDQVRREGGLPAAARPSPASCRRWVGAFLVCQPEQSHLLFKEAFALPANLPSSRRSRFPDPGQARA